MIKNVKLDKEKCISCGNCALEAPEVFEMGDDGTYEIKGDIDIEKNEAGIKKAASACPSEAITFDE